MIFGEIAKTAVHRTDQMTESVNEALPRLWHDHDLCVVLQMHAFRQLDGVMMTVAVMLMGRK